MPETDTLIDWPEEGVARAPYAVFSDPDVYAAEMRRIFRGAVWHYLGLEAELPEPGDYRLIDVGDTPVIVLRTPDGGINALVNRCAHKGTMLLFEPFGRVDRLMCIYHNWSYDLEGCLKSVPFARGIDGKGGMPDSFDMAANGLDRLRVESLGGIIFGTFSDATPPLEAYIGERLMANYRRMTSRPFKVLGYYSQYLDSNWKLYFENASDPYHATILHAWATRLKLNRFTMEGAIEMSEQGWHHLSWSKMATDRHGEVYETEAFRSGGGNFDEFGLHDASVIEQWDEFGDGITTAIQTAFPNFVLQQIHNTIATRYLVPARTGGLGAGMDRAGLCRRRRGADPDPAQAGQPDRPVGLHLARGRDGGLAGAEGDRGRQGQVLGDGNGRPVGRDHRQQPRLGMRRARLLDRLSRVDGRLMATLVEDSAHVPAAIAALMADYVHAIDDDRLEDWPDFFTDPCIYRIATRDNEERGLPASLVWCDSRAMLLDRVVSVRHANVFEPHRYRHMVSAIRVVARESAEYRVHSNYLVTRTMRDGTMAVFSTGAYRDVIVVGDEGARFRERVVVCDHGMINNLIAIPI